jgi:hypothetical protein
LSASGCFKLSFDESTVDEYASGRQGFRRHHLLPDARNTVEVRMLFADLFLALSSILSTL